MTHADTIGLALRNLRQAKLRTALTTLGVSIGIASLAGMVSLGVGLQDQLVGRFMQSGVFDAITVVSPSMVGIPAAMINGRGGLRAGVVGQRGSGRSGTNGSSSPNLSDDVLKQISAMENVREVYPNLRFPVELTLSDFSQLVTVAGVPMSSKGEGAFQSLPHGEFFSSESGGECLLGLGIAKQIAEQNPGSLVGKNAKVSYAAGSIEGDPASGFQVRRVDHECRIVGIVERDPAILPIGGGPPAALIMPLTTAKTIDAEIISNAQSLLRDSSQPKSYSSITVRVNQARFTDDVEGRIRRQGYVVFSVSDALRGAKNAFIVLDIFLSLIGSIALAVSSLGIVNTMVMSILERTREIGIMKAIGAGDNDIRLIFLVEASVIGLLGGIAGTALGWLVGRIINFGANLYIRSQGGTPGTLFSLPIWLIATAIGFSILVSLIAGSYPASRAARLDPIQALRHD